GSCSWCVRSAVGSTRGTHDATRDGTRRIGISEHWEGRLLGVPYYCVYTSLRILSHEPVNVRNLSAPIAIQHGLSEHIGRSVAVGSWLACARILVSKKEEALVSPDRPSDRAAVLVL